MSSVDLHLWDFNVDDLNRQYVNGYVMPSGKYVEVKIGTAGRNFIIGCDGVVYRLPPRDETVALICRAYKFQQLETLMKED
jgi:hypothetical protein